MATFETQSDLVVQTVRDFNDLAEDAYRTAKDQLDILAASAQELPLSIVDVNIGDDADINWTVTVVPPDAPEEPDYSSDLTPPTLTDVTVPAEIDVTTAPTWDADLSGTPDAMAALDLSAVAELGTLPTIDAQAPTIDVDLLDSDFTFSEPVYVERVSPFVETEIRRVLGGDLGLPQSYWDALWSEAAGSLARQQAARLRAARNRGAASYWPMPGETVLAEASRIQDEGARALQMDRLEKAKQQAVFANQDFWRAISQGIAYENQWIGAHQQMAARAIAAAEQLHAARVQVHNANVARFNMLLEAARIDGTLQDLQVKRVLEQHRSELAANAAEIEQDKQVVARYQAQWAGYEVDTRAQISNLGEQVKYWLGQAGEFRGYEGLLQEKNKVDVQAYSAKLGAIDSAARATAAILGARVNVAELDLRAQLGVAGFERDRNAIEIERTKITQAAQEAAARIDVAQAQWMGGQGRDIQQRVAELAFGWAQAAVAAADVGLSSSVGISLSGDA